MLLSGFGDAKNGMSTFLESVSNLPRVAKELNKNEEEC